ncbi:glycosyltransferase family 2 protein [Aerolutibacter daejeonensis]|uniref:glycosyltransferase family 2 protein n=1 Tax=Aerolutibacter daejeonensis TaxID=346181 RepID=UPI0018DDA7E9|nr:glycosyltransferase family 2 protein [Lysobacter daejeonensis]
MALLACHNRKKKTVECLAAFYAQGADLDVALSAVLVDDGSSDGTADAVRAEFPDVAVERGDGNLFWCRGMHRAQEVAVKSRPDFLLWLNDDTTVAPGALRNLLAVHDRAKERGQDVVVVGTTIDPTTSALSYGGLKPVSRLRRYSFVKLPISSESQECVAMNGNIVLVPRAIYERVDLDPVFEHALGDIDYALRVRAAGFSVAVAPGFSGSCSANVAAGTSMDPSLPMWARWQKFIGRKGLPPSSWRHFVKRHAGWAWPLYFTYPYVNFVLRIAKDCVLGKERN